MPGYQMTELFFVDSNILVYRRDAYAKDKQTRADEWLRMLWRRGQGRLSIQVLNEFYVTVTQKLKPGMAQQEARDEVTDFFAWKPVAMTSWVVQAAFVVQSKYALSYWDSLIVSAAQAAQCRYLLTEDLQHGQEFDGLVVTNPFLQAPE